MSHDFSIKKPELQTTNIDAKLDLLQVFVLLIPTNLTCMESL